MIILQSLIAVYTEPYRYVLRRPHSHLHRYSISKRCRFRHRSEPLGHSTDDVQWNLDG